MRRVHAIFLKQLTTVFPKSLVSFRNALLGAPKNSRFQSIRFTSSLKTAGIDKESLFAIPFRKAPVVEGFHVVGDDEWNQAVGECLF